MKFNMAVDADVLAGGVRAPMVRRSLLRWATELNIGKADLCEYCAVGYHAPFDRFDRVATHSNGPLS